MPWRPSHRQRHGQIAIGKPHQQRWACWIASILSFNHACTTPGRLRSKLWEVHVVVGRIMDVAREKHASQRNVKSERQTDKCRKAPLRFWNSAALDTTTTSNIITHRQCCSSPPSATKTQKRCLHNYFPWNSLTDAWARPSGSS